MRLCPWGSVGIHPVNTCHAHAQFVSRVTGCSLSQSCCAHLTGLPTHSCSLKLQVDAEMCHIISSSQRVDEDTPKINARHHVDSQKKRQGTISPLTKPRRNPFQTPPDKKFHAKALYPLLSGEARTKALKNPGNQDTSHPETQPENQGHQQPWSSKHAK